MRKSYRIIAFLLAMLMLQTQFYQIANAAKKYVHNKSVSEMVSSSLESIDFSKEAIDAMIRKSEISSDRITVNDSEVEDKDIDLSNNSLISTEEFDFDPETGTITKYKGEESRVVIPEEIEGVKVKIIGSRAFAKNSFIADIEMPEGILEIGMYAFSRCTSLENIGFLPRSVTRLKYGAFLDCTGLKNVLIPKSIISMEGAFQGCPNIHTVEVENGMEKLPSGAFSGLSGLKTVILPDSITEIGRYAFSECTSLNNIDFLPDTITEIGSGAFVGCRSLKNINPLPKNITRLGEGAFSGCESLKTIFIPKSITSMSSAFEGCSNIHTIEVENGMEKLPDYGFHGLTGLKTVILPKSMTEIGDYAFYECNSLEDLDFLPTNLTTLGNNSFAYCTSVVKVKIPESVVYIGKTAFNNCSNLVEVTIGPNVEVFDIDEDKYLGVFNECTNLETVIVENGMVKIPERAFSGLNKLSKVILPDTITEIGSGAFGGCTSLKNIDFLPDTIIEIGSDAFYGCKGLVSLVFSDSVTRIGRYAFGHCDGLKEVTIPAYCNQEGWDNQFYYCENLKKVIFQDGRKTVPKYLLRDLPGLEEVIMPNSIIEIEPYAFENCTSIKNIDFLPKNITTIGNGAFRGCTSLESVESLPETITKVGAYAFSKCSALTKVIIPKGIKTIEAGTFEYCEALNIVKIPESIIEINGYPFIESNNVVIHGIENSFAEKYAKLHEIPFRIWGTDAEDDIPPEGELSSPIKDQVYTKSITIEGKFNDNLSIANIELQYSNNGADYEKIISLTAGVSEKSVYYVWDIKEISSGDVWVRAVVKDLNNNVLTTEPIKCIVDNEAPPIPVNLKSNVSNAKIELSWDKVEADDFSHYILYRSVDGEEIKPYTYVYREENENYIDNIVDFLVGQEITYYVTSVDKYGNESAPGNMVTIVISDDTVKPTLDVISPKEGAEVTHSTKIDFTAKDDKKLGNIIVYVRKTTESDWSKVAEQSLQNYGAEVNSSIIWKHKDYETGPVSIKIVLTDTSGNEVEILRNLVIKKYTQSFIKDLVATESHRSVSLEWDVDGSIYDGTSFRIMRSSTIDGEYTEVGTSYVLGYSDFVDPGTYYYRIEATDFYGEEVRSESAIGKSLIIDNQPPIARMTLSTRILRVGQELHFNAEDSIDNDVIELYQWDFGDGSVAEGVTANHAYTELGEYKVVLTVKDAAGLSSTAEYRIKVVDLDSHSDYREASIEVIDADESKGIKDVTITLTIDEAEVSLKTDENGLISTILPIGEYKTVVMADGYQLRQPTLAVKQDESNEFKIALSRKGLVQGEFKTKEMTYEEIFDAGIDIDDIENKHVFEYKITFEFKDELETFPITITWYFEQEKYNGNGGYEEEEAIYKPNKPGESRGKTHSPRIEIPDGFGGGSGYDFGAEIIDERFLLVIYGKATWLKEMYKTELFVLNSSPVDTLDPCTVELILPEGLSLPRLHSNPQETIQELGPVEPLSTKKLDWVIRGDKEGEYKLKGKVTGSYKPNPEDFEFTFESETPIVVQAGNQLRLDVYMDDTAYRGEPYTVELVLKNVSDKPVFNLRHEITALQQFKRKTTYRRRPGETEFVKIIEDKEYMYEDVTGREGSYFFVNELKPGEERKIKFETDILFYSTTEQALNLGKLGVKAAANFSHSAKAVSVMLNFVNIKYTLINSQIEAMENSTTVIPTSFYSKAVGQDRWKKILLDNFLDVSLGLITKYFSTKYFDGAKELLIKPGINGTDAEWFEFIRYLERLGMSADAYAGIATEFFKQIIMGGIEIKESKDGDMPIIIFTNGTEVLKALKTQGLNTIIKGAPLGDILELATDEMKFGKPDNSRTTFYIGGHKGILYYNGKKVSLSPTFNSKSRSLFSNNITNDLEENILIEITSSDLNPEYRDGILSFTDDTAIVKVTGISQGEAALLISTEDNGNWETTIIPYNVTDKSVIDREYKEVSLKSKMEENNVKFEVTMDNTDWDEFIQRLDEYEFKPEMATIDSEELAKHALVVLGNYPYNKDAESSKVIIDSALIEMLTQDSLAELEVRTPTGKVHFDRKSLYGMALQLIGTEADHVIVEIEKPISIKDDIEESVLAYTPKVIIGDKLAKNLLGGVIKYSIPVNSLNDITIKNDGDTHNPIIQSSNVTEGEFVFAARHIGKFIISGVKNNESCSEYEVKVESGNSSQEKATAGKLINIVADTAPKGKVFEKWISDDVELVDPFETETIFIMPEKNVNIIASYKSIDNRKLEIGIVYDGSNEIHVAAQPGKVVTVYNSANEKLGYATINNDGNAIIKVNSESIIAGQKIRFVMSDDENNELDSVIVIIRNTKGERVLETPKINMVLEGDTRITGTGKPGSTIFVTLPNGDILEGLADSSGKFTLNFEDHEIVAGKLLKIVAQDEKGNTSPEIVIQIARKTEKPIPNTPVLDSINEETKFISGNGSPNSKIKVIFNDGTELFGTTDNDGNFKMAVSDIDLKEGDRLIIQLIDSQGNNSPFIIITVGSKKSISDKKVAVDSVEDAMNKITGIANPKITIIVTDIKNNEIGKSIANDEGLFEIEVNPIKIVNGEVLKIRAIDSETEIEVVEIIVKPGIDSDGDGLSDNYENNISKTDPNLKDTDEDGLSDFAEVKGLFKDVPDIKTEYDIPTNPLKRDTDEDGYSDLKELELGTDPNNSKSLPMN